MSLKQEIETWVKSLEHYDNNEFDEALKTFDLICDTSKILFNCGVIHATLGEHEKAVDCYQRAVRLDQYLAVAYFQQGVSNFLMGDFEEALANFNDTLLYLRGNNHIDYEQLGLKFKLYSCEVLFNRGLCYIYLQQKEAGMQDLDYASKEKVVQDHDVIDEAIKEQAEGYTVFSIPVGIVYRPNEAKVKNLKAKDYLGKARLVAATDRSNAFTGFAGAEIKKMNEQPAPAATTNTKGLDDKISFTTSNLVKPDLRSRTRQQSEPPINRNVFPPTPPPENDRPAKRNSDDSSGMSRAQSVRGGGPKPPALELGRAAFDRNQREKPRLGTVRSASERPRPSREYSSASSGRSRDGDRMREYRRATSDGDDSDERERYDDLAYDVYGRDRPRNSGRSSRRQRPMYIAEEEEDDDYEGSDFDDAEFEMVSRAKSSRRRSPQVPVQRRPEIKKIRVKVHADDTRYVMINSNIEFKDFAAAIRDKFGMRSNFKIKMKDEGDMITMADQDDLDMAVSTCKQAAKREKAEMGKMEVWVQEVSSS